MTIWTLLATGKNNVGVTPNDLSYFNTYFIAESMIDKWEVPPLNYLNKSKNLEILFLGFSMHPLSLKEQKT